MMTYKAINEITGETAYIVGEIFTQACEKFGYNPLLWKMVSQEVF